MKIYILTERAKSNGSYHDRIVGCYESYDYAVLEKAKLSNANPLNFFYINGEELIQGEVSTWEQDGEISLKNEDFETIAVVDFILEEEHYHYEKDVTAHGIVIWEQVSKWEADNVSIFDSSLNELGLSDELTREINNQIDNEVERLNDEL